MAEESVWHLGGGGMALYAHSLPTLDGSSVGLPPNTIYVHPSTGRLYKTT